MRLLEALTFVDSSGREWTAPEGAFLNGATIPQFLWTSLGPPFVGEYRRPSIVHDFFVGEGSNPDVTREQREEADFMFREACLADGVSQTTASILFAGVRFGSWMSDRERRFLPPFLDFFEARTEATETGEAAKRHFWARIEALEQRGELNDPEAVAREFKRF